MLERLISDILKWLVIILIFFFAFACSLFLIFSYFAVSLQHHYAVDETPTSPFFYRNISTSVSSDARCPSKFFYLTNYSIVDLPTGPGSQISLNDEENFCMKTQNYDKIREVGSHPAISYFGQSFGATILTTFFTLFGVIAEDDVPVRFQRNTFSFHLSFVLGSRL